MAKNVDILVPQIIKMNPLEVQTDVLILPYLVEGTQLGLTKGIDKALQGEITERMSLEKIEGNGAALVWFFPKNLTTKRILILAFGSRKNITRDSIRDAYASAAKQMKDTRIEKAAILDPKDKAFDDDFDAALEGFLLGAYRFDRYLEKKPSEKLRSLQIVVADSQDEKRIAKFIHVIDLFCRATSKARDWINEPANVVNPEYFEKEAERIAKECRLKLKVLTESDLKKLGMNLILAVGNGSQVRPRLLHLEYRPTRPTRKSIALVGKGVTFDSGGYSLKPQSNMYGMKCDMSGAAAVLSTIWAVGQLKPQVHVHAIVPLVENLVDGRATKPGDIVVGYSGKSVEIENTDAEGRLILADALFYAQKLKPQVTLDVATLTGACPVALGEEIAGLMTDDDKLCDRIMEAGKKVGEKYWRLPLEKNYAKLLKSDVADIKNVGGRYAGTITAALFLKEFAPKEGWAHLDIAGPAFLEKDWPIAPKGGTGFAVRTFLELIQTA